MVVDARLGRVAGGVADRNAKAGQQDEGKQGDSQRSLQSRRAVCRDPHPVPCVVKEGLWLSRETALAVFFLNPPFSIVATQ